MANQFLEDFAKNIGYLKPFCLNIEDTSFTMANLGFDVQLLKPSIINMVNDEELFNKYTDSLRTIVEQNGGIVQTDNDAKKITCVYDNLEISCSLNALVQNCSFFIKRIVEVKDENEENEENKENEDIEENANVKTTKKTYIYNIGECGTPYLFIILNLKFNYFTQDIFRYTLVQKDKEETTLFLLKQDAINAFRDIMSNNLANIERIDLNAVSTKGSLIDKENNVIACLDTKYETDDIKINLNMSNMDLFVSIYNLLVDDYPLDKISEIFDVIGFTIVRNSGFTHTNMFSKVYESLGFNLIKSGSNIITISNKNGYNLEIMSIPPAYRNPNDGNIMDGLFKIKVFLDSSGGGRKYIIAPENFNEYFPNKTDFSYYTFEEICIILRKIMELPHNYFPYTLLSTAENNIELYRYKSFDLGLNALKGFYNLSRENDYIFLDIQKRVGKSYKIYISNQKRYDYVYLDKNENIAKIYVEFLATNPNYSQLL